MGDTRLKLNGSLGQVLTSNGEDKHPTFQSATGGMIQVTEVTFGYDLGATNGSSVANSGRYYEIITLPTTEKLYEITGFTWGNGNLVAGNIMCGADIIDANPPVSDDSAFTTFTLPVAQSGVNQEQRNNNVVNKGLIRGGTPLGIWVIGDNSNGKIAHLSGQTSSPVFKSVSFIKQQMEHIEVTAFANQTKRYNIQVHIVGYK